MRRRCTGWRSIRAYELLLRRRKLAYWSQMLDEAAVEAQREEREYWGDLLDDLGPVTRLPEIDWTARAAS